MSKETITAREGKVNPINGVRSGNLDRFDMLSTESRRKQEIRQRIDILKKERDTRQRSAPPGYSVNYPEEYWRLQNELWKLNGIIGVK